MNLNTMVDGVELITGFEKGGEDLGVDEDTTVYGGVDIFNDSIECLIFGLGVWGLWDRDWGWR